ncbi:MAG: ribonuclease HI family protein [bacterium]|nr:ribonuclease HI family protein [bacterium]
MKLIVNTDGGARGNPGPAGIGVVVERCGNIVYEASKYIGETTNNQAEYRALIEALEWVSENRENEEEVECRLDSELVVKQLNGEYRLKNEGLRPLYQRVVDLRQKIGGRMMFCHVGRGENKRADRLVNKAIDLALK